MQSVVQMTIALNRSGAVNLDGEGEFDVKWTFSDLLGPVMIAMLVRGEVTLEKIIQGGLDYSNRTN